MTMKTKRKPKRSTPPPAPTGRPLTEITNAQWRHLERMASAMCTHEEMADHLGIGKRTLYEPHLKERFERLTRMKRAASILDVRERQLEAAKKGQPVGSIWWGKQHLGQKDKHEHEHTGGALDVIAGAEERLTELLNKLAAKRKAR